MVTKIIKTGARVVSRSRKKTPKGGAAITKSREQKKFKRQEHKRERSKVRDMLKQGKYDVLPSPKQYGNEWASPRDGKFYFGTLLSKWYNDFIRYMRK